MDFSDVDTLMEGAGISKDPAFNDLNIAIVPLPDKYQGKGVLGLYYPETTTEVYQGRQITIPAHTSIIPPDAHPKTLFHELGHAHHNYFYRDISEAPADKYMTKHTPAMRTEPRPNLVTIPVMRSGPVKQTGNYTKILNVDYLKNAVPGTEVTVAVTIQNISTQTLHIYCVGVLNSQTRFIDWVDTYLLPGDSGTLYGSFAMPNMQSQIDIYSFYIDPSSGQTIQDVTFTGTIAVSQYTSITGSIIRTSISQGGKPVIGVPPGEKFDLSVAYYANNPAGGSWSVGLVLSSPDSGLAGKIVDSTSLFGGNTLGAADGSITKTFTGLVMPNQLSVSLVVDMYVNPAYSQFNPPPGTGWNNISTTTVVVQHYYPTPEELGYTQISDAVYPDGEIYSGYAEQANFTYVLSDAEVLLFSGLMPQKLADAFNNSANQNAATMLGLKIYKRQSRQLDSEGNPMYDSSGKPILIPNSTDFLAIATAHPITSTNAATQLALPVGGSLVNWTLIIKSVINLIIVVAIIVGAYILIRELDWSKKQTTYTPPQTKQLAPNTSYTATVDGITYTDGGSGSTVYDANNNQVATIPPNGTATIPSGDHVVAGSGGGTANIPGYSTTQYEQGNSLTNVIKDVAIAGGVIIGGLVILDALNVFGPKFARK